MENVLHNALLKLDGYLLSIQKNTDTGKYELEVGIRNTWVYKSTDEIECEAIHESESGNIVKIFGVDDEIVIDDLVDFVRKIIKTNKKIAEMEEEFQKRLEEQKKLLEDQIRGFQNELEMVKEKSFDDEDDEDDEEEIIIPSSKDVKSKPAKVSPLSDSEKEELEQEIK